jgi:tellurite resistance protein TehA-like permease
MIFLIAHIVFAIFGIAALSKGTVSMSKKSEISGAPARLIGILALLSYPIAWIIGFCFGLYWGTNHPGTEFPLSASLFINVGAFVIVGIAIFLVARKAPKGEQIGTDQPATAPESKAE